jgi:predicted LPLAT superfamily acyltransferase
MKSVLANYCFLIPCYETHAITLKKTISDLLKFNIDIFVIDDGSSDEYAALIQKTVKESGATCLVNPENGGKGSAFKLGLKHVHDKKYSHCIQVDADGQHHLDSVEQILEKSLQNSEELVSGIPIYDESVPKGRLWGRYLTHVWVWIETLSFKITDSMCGLRCYPVESTNRIVQTERVGDHMDFDTEIIVRQFWRGTPMSFVPVRVIYPEGGDSYFYALKDNVRITKMHTRLFFGMLLRFPKILKNKFSEKDWSSSDERGALFLMKFTVLLYKLFGDRAIRLLVKVICFYYYLFATSARSNSKRYIKIYHKYCLDNNITTKRITTFSHILSFGNMFVDKLAVWNGAIKRSDFIDGDTDRLYALRESNKGALFISSHFGNTEITRALGGMSSDIKFNVLYYTDNSKKLFSLLKEFSPEVEDNIIPVSNFGPEVGALISEKIENGEWIFYAGDRLTVESNKVLDSKLLGLDIKLPQGPFLLGYLFDAPVYSFHCYKIGDKYKIDIKDLTPSIKRERKTRDLYVKEIAENYTREIQRLMAIEPGQWFNFYNYWKNNDKH